MKLRCKSDTSLGGIKVLNFTKGEIYEFTETNDPPGFETFDDEGKKIIFFDTTIIFEEI